MVLRERRRSGSRRAEAGTGSSFKCAYIIINVFVVPVAAIIVAAAPVVVVVVVRSALNVRTLRVFAECGRNSNSNKNNISGSNNRSKGKYKAGAELRKKLDDSRV